MTVNDVLKKLNDIDRVVDYFRGSQSSAEEDAVDLLLEYKFVLLDMKVH
jgi:hypothetical protein